MNASSRTKPTRYGAALIATSIAMAPASTGIEAQQMSPDEYVELRDRADSLGRAASFAEAAGLYARVVEINPYDDGLWLAYARYAGRSDKNEEARALERVIELGSDQRSRLMVRLAGVYADLGMPDRAFDWLERALGDRLETRPTIRNMRQFEPYRDDPRFRELAGLLEETTDRVTGWRTDLEWLVTEVKRLHAGPTRPAFAVEFDEAVASLDARIPELDDEALALEFQRIMVMLGDGHSALWSTPTDMVGFPALPIDLYWFSDGLFVTGGDGPAAAHVGHELVSVGGIPVESLIEGTESLITRDNLMGIRSAAPSLLRRMSVLRELGAADDLTSAEVELRGPDGVMHTVTLESAGSRSAWRPGPIPGAGAEAPRWLRSDSNLWMEHVAPGAMYVQYSAVRNPSGSSVAAFADSLYRELETADMDAVIIDVRRNGGGNNFLNWPLVRTLIRFEADRPGRRIYMLAGRHTFSAAQNFSNWVNRLTGAVFLGEPSGSSANFTGETTPINLPFSGLRASVSSRYWQDSHATDTRIWIAPDVPIELDSSSYFENRDPVLEYVLRRIESGRTASD